MARNADHEGSGGGPGAARTTGEPDGRTKPGLRTYLTWSWVVIIVAFTIGRVIVAKEALGDYGLNIWVFGFIDLITAVPYAIGTAKVVTSMIDREPSRSMGWGLVAVASFLAPYLYVMWSGRDAEFPPAVWTVLGVLILVFGGNAVWSTVRKVRSGRADHHAQADAPGAVVDPVSS